MYADPNVIPSGTSFSQFQAGGCSGLLERLIEANATPNGWTAIDYQLVRAAKDGNLEDVYRRLRQLCYDFNRGSPVGHDSVIANLKKSHNAFAVLGQLCHEIGELIDANPGEIVECPEDKFETRFMRIWPPMSQASDEDPEYKSANYKPCHCRDDCSFLWLSTPDRPCWGQVCAIDEFEPGGWLHGCQAHRDHEMPGDMYREYIPEGDAQ